MKSNRELLNVVATFFKHDTGLEFFAPGFVNATAAEKDLIPWMGMQNLNRCVYLALTFYFFFYNEMIAEVSIGFNDKKTEAIILEIKDDFVEMITDARSGVINSKITPMASTKTLMIKELFEFVSSKPGKFNEIYENDPNIKALASIEGTIAQPLIMTNKEVYDYYAKNVKVVFGK
jgi:hypothetical protein